MQDTIISKTLPFLLLYMSGTKLVGKLKTQEVSQFFKDPPNLYQGFQIFQGVWQ